MSGFSKYLPTKVFPAGKHKKTVTRNSVTFWPQLLISKFQYKFLIGHFKKKKRIDFNRRASLVAHY